MWKKDIKTSRRPQPVTLVALQVKWKKSSAKQKSGIIACWQCQNFVPQFSLGVGGCVRKKSLVRLCSTVWQSIMHTLTLSRDAPVSHTDTFPLSPYLNHCCLLSSSWRLGGGGSGARWWFWGKRAAWRYSADQSGDQHVAQDSTALKPPCCDQSSIQKKKEKKSPP